MVDLIDTFLEVALAKPDDFLKVKETLTRIGISSKKDKNLYQSCHILHKQGRYYIIHFKELFALDGKETNITTNDIARRNTIASLLEKWGLLAVLENEYNDFDIQLPSLAQLKIVSFKEKNEWNLVSKYNIGIKKPFTKS